MGAANQSSNAETSWEFLVLGFEFKNLPNREIHEIREKEMKKIALAVLGVANLRDYPVYKQFR